MNKQNPFELPGGTPFNLGKKIGEGTFSEVYEAENNPDLAVKRVTIEDLYRSRPEDIITTEDYSEEEFRERYQNGFRYLERKLKDYLPETQLVFGNNEKRGTCGYIIQRRIYPDKPAFFDRKGRLEKAEALDEVLATLVKFYVEQLTREKVWHGRTLVFMPDFVGSKKFIGSEEEDMIYGHTSKDSAPHFYLPDIYPLLPMRDPLDFVPAVIRKIKKGPNYSYHKTKTALGILRSRLKSIYPESKK